MKTVEEVRRERLAELKSEFGSFATINAKIDRLSTDSTLSQIANASIGSKTKKPKTMGSEQARLLEEKLQKPRGWMDTDPDLLQGTSFSPPTLAKALEVVAARLNELSDSSREHVAQHLQTLARAPDSRKALESALQAMDKPASGMSDQQLQDVLDSARIESADIFRKTKHT